MPSARAAIRRPPKPPPIKEKHIENSILSWLAIKRVPAWKVESQGTFDQKIGRYRLKHSVHRLLGVSDIIGVMPGSGRLLAIEVKSARGKLSEHQAAFLAMVNDAGGLAFVARSIDDVELRLRDAWSA